MFDTNEIVRSQIYRTQICYYGFVKHLGNLNADGKTSEMIDSLQALKKMFTQVGIFFDSFSQRTIVVRGFLIFVKGV